MKIESPKQAIQFLESIGYFVRKATMEEKRGIARKVKQYKHRPWVSPDERGIYDNFKKVCYAIFSNYSSNCQILSPKDLIKYVKWLRLNNKGDKIDRHIKKKKLDKKQVADRIES